jgi:hypothetical protein
VLGARGQAVLLRGERVEQPIGEVPISFDL